MHISNTSQALVSRLIIALLLVAGSISGVWMTMPIRPAHAASYIVTNLADSGAGSLRAAVILANASIGVADTITFSVSGTITLTTGQIVINDPLTITGPGTGLLTISGNNVSRIFLMSGIGTIFNISALTIANGKTANSGGGVFNDNSGPLTITNSTFSGNSASGGGGGVYSNGTLTVTNSTFSGNSASGGGGVRNDGTLTVTNSTFSGNSATDNGGGIYNDGTLTIANSAFSGNSSEFNGGGVYNDGTLSVSNSTFSDNSALSYGGAIRNDSTLTITNSTLSRNSADYGGGILNAPSGMLTVTNSTLSGNSATNNGGGVNNFANGLWTIKNSIVAGNTAPADTNIAGAFTALGVNITSGDPGLLPLANNGGPTQTFGLTNTSPARDAATDCTAIDGVTPITTDQRGVARPINGVCDVGAFEAAALQAPPAPSTAPAPAPAPVFATPLPVPLCALIGGGTNSIVRANVPSGLNADVFCRVLAENRNFVTSAAEVGDLDLINAGVLQAVDVFGFAAGNLNVTRFNFPVTVCLLGNGRLFFRDANFSPRMSIPLATTVNNGYTCGTVSSAGTLILVS